MIVVSLDFVCSAFFRLCPVDSSSGGLETVAVTCCQTAGEIIILHIGYNERTLRRSSTIFRLSRALEVHALRSPCLRFRILRDVVGSLAAKFPSPVAVVVVPHDLVSIRFSSCPRMRWFEFPALHPGSSMLMDTTCWCGFQSWPKGLSYLVCLLVGTGENQMESGSMCATDALDIIGRIV